MLCPAPLFLLPIFPMLIPPPTLSTLFPYTTLFRSESDKLQNIDMIPIFSVEYTQPPTVQSRWDPYVNIQGSLAELDRKSTRLNSSHVAISYAVFCLQKKKN